MLGTLTDRLELVVRHLQQCADTKQLTLKLRRDLACPLVVQSVIDRCPRMLKHRSYLDLGLKPAIGRPLAEASSRWRAAHNVMIRAVAKAVRIGRGCSLPRVRFVDGE